MALYRGTVKVSGIGQSFNPENTGTEGQVLTKTNRGYAYCDPQGGNSGPKVDVIVVAGGGGGGGGNCCPGGGGGGGGVKECKQYHLEGNSTSVVVGARGTLGTGTVGGTNGGDSYFGSLKACGGGRGGNCCGYEGCNGGNGGGGEILVDLGNNNYVKNLPSGLDGGHSGGYGPGGGGGAGGAGGQTCTIQCIIGIGGQGYNSSMFCTNCFFGGGGSGGGGCLYAVTPGGGGKYIINGSWTLGDATFYGGGGGGGGGNSCANGTNGYQGVVMVRYPTDGSYGVCSSTGGNCCFTCDGYCYVEFTSDGTFCITG